MALVSATRSSSPPRNQLLAAMSATDLALLRPHLQPVTMPLLKDMERPNRRIETVYFMETGIASVVAVQPDETRVEVGLIGREGMSGNSRGAGRRSIAAFHLHPGRRGRAADPRQGIAQGNGCESNPAELAAQIRSSLHGADDSHRHRKCSRSILTSVWRGGF